MVVYLGQDPATGRARRKWYTYPTRGEAQAQLSHILTQLHGGGALPSTKLRTGEYLEKWLHDYAGGAVAPTTFARYQEIVSLHLTSALGFIPLQKLSPQAIQGYFTAKLASGLSSTTVRHHATLLHGALRHAVKWGLLARNPADMVDPPRRCRSEIRVLDEEQVRLFLAEARRSSVHYRLYLAALTTGMRQGELLGLRWRDVDLSLGVASVQQTFYRLGKRMLFKEPKTATARRTVALLSVLVQELLSLRGEQRVRHGALGDAYKDRDLVFCQPDGRPLHANNIARRDLRRVLKKAKLPTIRFHDLRHCHATLLLRQGIHPKVVQERLGHSSPAFTLHVYSHVLPGMQEEVVRRLDQALREKPE